MGWKARMTRLGIELSDALILMMQFIYRKNNIKLPLPLWPPEVTVNFFTRKTFVNQEAK